MGPFTYGIYKWLLALTYNINNWFPRCKKTINIAFMVFKADILLCIKWLPNQDHVHHHPLNLAKKLHKSDFQLDKMALVRESRSQDNLDDICNDSWCSQWPIRRGNFWLSIGILGSISSMFYEQLLCPQIPNVQKRQSSHQCLFALLGPMLIKAVCTMMVKMTQVVNFINILWAAYAPIF